ncbi:MAG: leucine-rich repeat domain-containing protein, partial [Mesorhizobium sp.]|nr:leucine-rich repeat domain-containing protein [Mesorhizobium sp.]
IGILLVLASAGAASAEQPKLVLVENVDLTPGDTRLHFPLLITNQRGYRLRCQAQSDEEAMIRGLGFLSTPAGVFSAIDPEITAAAPQDNPLLCPDAANYRIKVFAFSDETGLNHYLQFPAGFDSTTYTGRLYRPRCAGLVEALKVDLANAINADPRPFFGDALYDIDCIAGAPFDVRPESFAAWCTKTNLTEAEARTVDAILDSTPAGAAARGNAPACATAQVFLTSVNSINLSGLGLTELAPLSVLPNLTTLVLEGNEISELAPLGALRALTFLDLSGNKIANLAPLSLLSALTELDLSANLIGNLRPLSSNVALTRLHLAGNQISDVSPLRFLRALISLDLANNLVTGAGIEPLTGLSVLRSLNLSNNRIESIEALSQFAESTEILLAGNPIFGNATLTFAETCVLHRADATPFGFTIRAMIAQSGAQSCDAAAAALNSSPSLDLSSKMISDVRPVALIPNLTTLNLSSNAIVDADPLTVMNGLATLNLSGNSIVKIDGLARLINLTALDLSANPVDASRFVGACLVRNHAGMLTAPQGAEISALMTFAGQDKCLHAAEALKRATDVTLRNLGLTSVDYFPIFENARRLDLRQNALINVAPLRSLTRVFLLDLSGNQITSLADIGTMTSLEVLNLTGNPISSLGLIGGLAQLRSIQIANTQIANIRPLASLPLLATAQLAGLNINYTDIDDYCLVHRLDTFALLEARPFMLAIEPRLVADGIDPKNCPAVANWARTVQTLNLNKTNLSSIDPVRFFSDLTSLTMYDNRIVDASPVRNLTRLVTLNLGKNRIEAIPTLQSAVLKNLTLNLNRIVFVQALQPKASLVSLRLDDNRIRDARALNNLANLTYLDLRSNQIATGEGVNGLFPRNPYLKGNPVCDLPVIMIFPPPPIVDACRREPIFGWVLNSVLHDNFILNETIRPHVLNPRPFGG